MALNEMRFEISAANSFSPNILLSGYFGVSIDGEFVGTVYVQRSFDMDKATDAEREWKDVDSYTAITEKTGHDPAGALYRVGAKTGGWTSGTAKIILNQ